MKKTILHVGALPPPYGGVAVNFQAIINSDLLKEYEHEVFNIGRGTDYEIVGLKKFEIKRVFRRILFSIQLLLKSKQVKPDIVHFHCGSGGKWDFLGDMLLLFSIRIGCNSKLLFHWHRDPSTASFPGNNWFTNYIFSKTAGKADAIGVLLDEYRDYLVKNNCATKIFVINNVFAPELLNISSNRTKNKNTNVLYLGRLTREKGIYDLLKVAEMTIQKIPNVNFILAGSASPAEGGIEKIKDYLSENGLNNNVKFVGQINGDLKSAFFAEGDVFFFPSYRESFGIAVLEALAAGLPVIGYSVGALSQLSNNGKNILVAEKGDTDQLFNFLMMVLESEFIRKKMGEDGRRYIINYYHPNLVFNKIKFIYKSIL